MRITRRTFNAMAAGTAAAFALGSRASAASIAGIMPPGAVDTHNHVMGPQAKYPYSPNRPYTPPEATVDDLKRLRAQIGVARNVIVTPTPYGFDNRSTVDAVVELGPTARGVVLLPPDVSESEFNRLEAAGIRGARLNTQNPALKETLTAWAPKFRAINWHVQIVGQLPIIVSLGPQIATLGHPVVIDHFGGARGEDGVANKDFQGFLELVKTGNVYVKLSAPYDRTREPGYANMTPFARALIAARADRMLWGTNWPHPLPQQGVPITQISPYQNVDNVMLVTRLAEWCPDAATRKMILVDTPERLYRFPRA
jgi:predicted TIM-barrel fold metal-dependent hydrolase